MKRVLYLSNIEVPYRTAFFNLLAKHCELTVVYERERSANRDKNWTESVQRNYNVEYLGGLKVRNENGFSLKILKYISGKYDCVIVGCYNSPIQMFAITIMRLFKLQYILNVDGEVFLDGKGIKNRIKRFFLSGASKYLCAGERSAESLKVVANNKPIIPYYFSSLTAEELIANGKNQGERNNTVLVVGQYFDYKGMDIALEAARKNTDIKYKFVGMGKRTELFLKENHAENEKNIEFIPFLKKQDLESEYKKCAMLVLPSRQECWGLVINEAASFGMPIVSTWGSGAAVEFLADKYPQYLALSDNADQLYQCIKRLMDDVEVKEYERYLIEKTKLYSIEKCVQAHLDACEIEG